MLIPNRFNLIDIQDAFKAIHQELHQLKAGVQNNTVNITSIQAHPSGPTYPLTNAAPSYLDSLYLLKPPGNVTDSRSVLMSDIDDQVRHASRFPGADDSLKIGAAVDDLPPTGGIIDATGLEGGTWSVNPFTGVTMPVTLLMGVGTTTLSVAMNIPLNIDIRMPAGAIFAIPDASTFTLHLGESSLSQHFAVNEGAAIPGKVTLRRNYLVHSRWFDDGSHNELCIQRALDSIGDDSERGRGGYIVWVDDILRLRDTVVINNQAVTLDAGGPVNFYPTAPDTQGGFIWNGPADQPMLEVKDASIGGVIVQNTRFYGKPTARPRSAISFVSTGGSGSCIVRNCHIGMAFGDSDFISNDYSQLDSLVDGIRIGDSYDGGTGGTNDHIEITNCRIWGCTNAGVRQSSVQNSLGHWREINLFGVKYAFQVVSQVTISQCFVAAASDAVIYVPVLDDYAQGVSAFVYGNDIQSEVSGRHLLMDGACVIQQVGGGFATSANTAADTSIIKGQNNSSQSVYIRDFSLQDQVALGSWKITLKASDVFHACPKILEYHGQGLAPTIDMDTANGLEARMATKDFLFFDSTSLVGLTSNQFPTAKNLLMGQTGDFITFDQTKYHIPTRGLRIGDTQNYVGAWEITTLSTILKPVNGTATTTASGFFPAGSLVFGLTSRNLNGLGITAGTVQLGSGTSATKWNTNLAVTANTATTAADWDMLAFPGATTTPPPYFTQTAEDVVATVSGGTWSNSGWIAITGFVVKFLAPPGL